MTLRTRHRSARDEGPRGEEFRTVAGSREEARVVDVVARDLRARQRGGEGGIAFERHGPAERRAELIPRKLKRGAEHQPFAMLDRDVESSRDDRLPEIFSANRLGHVERLSWSTGRCSSSSTEPL